MARILGTGRPDFLRGTAGSDEIFGFRGNDEINASGLFDVHEGVDFIKGGRGDDNISLDAGIAFGGVGNDDIFGENATLGGGPGVDRLLAHGGALYGDEVPGERAPRFGGADTLIVTTNSAVTMTGGGGADKFIVNLVDDNLGNNAEVRDFRAGVDKLNLAINHADGSRLDQTQVFNLLDSNHDLVLNGLDTPAADGSSGIWNDTANNRLVLYLETTESGLGTERDHLIVNNVDHINAADWAFTY